MKPICGWCRRRLERHADLDEGLPPGSRAARHLEGCADCRAAWAGLRRLASDLPRALAAAPLSDEFSHEVWTRIEAAPLPRRTSPWNAPLALVTALAAGIVGVVLLGQTAFPPSAGLRESRPITPRPAATIAKRDPGQPQELRSHSGRLAPVPPTKMTRENSAQIAGSETAVTPPHSPRRQPPRLVTQPADEGSTVQHQILSPGPRLANAPSGPEEPDDRFLDGRDPSLLGRFTRSEPKEQERIEAILRGLPPPADDFVRIPLPRVAANDPAALNAALREYQREAKVVDPRLFRKVTLHAKGASLDELCALLREQTGVGLRASRTVADEKVTVFVKAQPARDVMRAVARLFNYLWGRSGDEGAYRYELTQDLKSQLAEEELRNADFRAAVLALDAEMEKYRPYLELSYPELEKRYERATREEKRYLINAVTEGWGGMQLYFRLTPAERAALVAGQEVVYRADSPDPDRRIPAEWQSPLLDCRGDTSISYQGQLTELRKIPGIQATQVRLSLSRSELGELTLKSSDVLNWKENGYLTGSSGHRDLATSRSPSVAVPDNRTANAAWKGKPPFDRQVSIRPEISCPALRSPRPEPPSEHRVSRGVQDVPHVLSSDVWEAVHRDTGQSIVADYYSRLYPLQKVTVERAPLFDALCTVADALGVRWTKDAEFLLARSTGFFWDKLKEVPRRHLERWQKDREANGGLPLADFLQIAMLSDQQLDARGVEDVVSHCLGIPEWRLLGGQWSGEQAIWRSEARFLSILTPEQLAKAMEPVGPLFRELTPAQQRAALELDEEIGRRFERQGSGPWRRPLEHYANAEIWAEYSPAGYYTWTPPESTPQRPVPGRLAPISARTAAEALAAARRVYPAAAPEQVRLSSALGRFNAGIRFVFYATPPAK